MLHLFLHFAVPVAVALVCYRDRWRFASLVLLATMLVDLDHLLADPIYDPARCSIGFHPLHTTPALVAYVLLTVLPLVALRRTSPPIPPETARILHLVGLGLLIHMGLDGLDCLL